MKEHPADREVLPWQRVRQKPGPDLRIFRARFDELVHPRTQQTFEATILETPDWVNIVAVTHDQTLVMVRQYRFGSERLSLEIPGGLINPGEGSRAAAERELREETGFVGQDWAYLGSVEPNSAFQDNLCHTWLARDVQRSADQDLDPGEDIAVLAVPLAQVARLVHDGEIRNSLIIVALARVLDLRLAKFPSERS
jgi:8-oxo-dGTP pyrophosphatase MutT (NUDIX family)